MSAHSGLVASPELRVVMRRHRGDRRCFRSEGVKVVRLLAGRSDSFAPTTRLSATTAFHPRMTTSFDPPAWAFELCLVLWTHLKR